MSEIPDYVAEHFARCDAQFPTQLSRIGVRSVLVTADGHRMSVQASENHYCSPRDNVGPYGAVEVWCFTTPSGDFWPAGYFANEDEPGGYIPVAEINAVIHEHGGLAA